MEKSQQGATRNMSMTRPVCSSARSQPLGWSGTCFLCFAAINWGIMTPLVVEAWEYFYGNKSDLSWDEARKFCKSYYTDLVAIQNQEEINHLNTFLPPHKNYYWIGIRKINNIWTWVGNNKTLTMKAENWATNEPNNKRDNQDCVEIYIRRLHEAGKWNDEPCEKRKRALCYQASCQPFSCSQHGQCVETIGNYTCLCHPGFYGPECEYAVQCQPLRILTHGNHSCSHVYGEFQFQSSCSFSCAEGFLLSGTQKILCAASGEWTAPVPACQAVQCESLQSPEQGGLVCSHPFGNFRYQSTCDFSCEHGFTLTGAKILRCLTTGNWNDPPPTCQAVQCQPLRILTHGNHSCSHVYGEFQFQSSCSFSCAEGFLLSGTQKILCAASGEWTAPVPACRAVQCESLQSPEQGGLVCSHPFGNFRYQSTCDFSCEHGFTLTGAKILRCLTTGNWNDPPPTCQVIKCPALEVPDNGHLTCSHLHGNFTYNSSCTFSCDTGFAQIGLETLKCTTLGKWTEYPPHCEAVQCQPLRIPTHGNHSCSHVYGEFQFQSSCSFSCAEGFLLSGTQKILCAASGEWTAPVPACQAVQCESLQSPERGGLVCSHPLGNFRYQSTCDFSCEHGFTLAGAKILHCLTTGKWNDLPPTCQVIKCPALEVPDNGHLTCSHLHGNFTYNSSCTFSCDTGFAQIGLETLKCTALGKWTGHPPHCEAAKCSALEAPDNGHLTCSHLHGDFTFNSSCTFSCDPGFTWVGPEMLKCTALGRWTEQLLHHCEAARCPMLEAPDNGHLTFFHLHGDFTYNSSCTFSCDIGFARVGLETLECTALGRWTGNPSYCEVVQCPQLSGLESMVMNCSYPWGPFSYQSVCRFRCAEGYILNGTRRLQCQHDGHWSGKMPVCIEEAASFFKQTLLYMGGAAAAVVALLLTGVLIVLLIKRLSNKEFYKKCK
uniref:p-selectin n=1 Tax=Sphenodon punctatus TaxID=8508 RepID=A0A8D0HH07_SPHPU